MNAIDELRQMADLQECGKAFVEIGQLRYLSDRIEQEYMELPRDKDGEIIHVGDMLVPAEKTTQNMVGSLFIVAAVSSMSLYDANGRCANPEWTEHRKPDTWERIEADADTPEERDLVRRCRALAGDGE
jgi:hypothetical protein